MVINPANSGNQTLDGYKNNTQRAQQNVLARNVYGGILQGFPVMRTAAGAGRS